MDDVKVEQIYLEDGREAERHVKDDGTEKVVELFVGPPRPEKTLAKRVVEKRRQVVCERSIETIENGEVVDRKIEVLEPKVEPTLIQHEVAAQQPQVHARKFAAPEESNFVTKEDLQEALVKVVKAVRKAPESKGEKAAAPKLSMQQVVGERVEQSRASVVNIGLAVLIAAQVVALGYLMFWM